MTKRWLKERRRDGYYRRAKAEGYRSRSAYKLLQMNKRFQLIGEGSVVVDLGASPGGWSQVAYKLVGEKGKVVAVDMKRMSPIEGVIIVRGNMTDRKTMWDVQKELGRKADAVISDMAPRLSGNRNIDHARSVVLAETALEFAQKTLKKGGNLLVKVFQGDLINEFLRTVSNDFQFSQAHAPKASASRSREIFVVGKGFRF